MSAARDAILAAVRRNAPAEAPSQAPSLSPRPDGDADRIARFAAALADAGGTCASVEDGEALATALAGIPAFANAARRASRVIGIPGCAPLSADPDPHALADLDFAVLHGAFGVAENGAVWIEPRDRAERAAAFLAEHVALVVPVDALVADLHDAYARLSLGRRGFGCFVAGPSKTADIEQALVIGAHGPRALSVFLISSPS